MARAIAVLLVSPPLAGCPPGSLSFLNATPAKPLQVPAWEYRPEGAGPFPAVVLLHGCHGVMGPNPEGGRWFRGRGYVALVVDSWSARGSGSGCDEDTPELPPTERFDDAVGALRLLHGRPYVDRARSGAIGWADGGGG